MNIYVLNGTLTFENALMPKVTTFEHSVINDNGAIVDTFPLYHVDVYDISKVYKLTISGMASRTYAWIFNDLGYTDKRRRIKDTDGEVEMCGKYLFVTVLNSTPVTFSTIARDDIFDYDCFEDPITQAYINSSGAITGLGTWTGCDLRVFSVESGKTYKLRGAFINAANYSAIAFFNCEYADITTQLQSNANTQAPVTKTDGYYEFTVPAGAKYMVVNFSRSGSAIDTTSPYLTYDI